jgi:cytochrome c oxidase subunit II
LKWIRWILFLPPGASSFADGIDLLHFAVISVTMIGATGVAGVALWYILRYRRRAPALPTRVLETTLFGEVTIIGSILGLFVIFWVIGFLQYVNIESPPADAMSIQVTAKQWMWKFSYPGARRSINVLTVPVGRPVRLTMTSRDVIHSFFVPAFRIKQDVIPGRYVTAWFQATAPGSYDIYCAEYCGVSHSRMLATVNVLSAQDYEAWLASRDDTSPLLTEDFERAGGSGDRERSDLAEQGRTLAARRECFACHTIDGQPHIGPTWRGLYESTVSLEGNLTVVADEAYLTRSMMDPMVDLVRGYRPVMPTYQGVLPATEAAAIVEYIKTLRADGVEPSVRLPTDAGAGLSD